MAFIHETTSSVSDLVSKIDAFLVANGWTQDQLSTGTGKAAWSKPAVGSGIYTSVRWDTASPNALGIYQALGFSGTGIDPGNHTGDSGNGNVSGSDATLLLARHAPLTSAPIEYWGFEDDEYAHFVVKTATTPAYVHFGMGRIDKIGDWTGGEYAYGFRHSTAAVGTSASLKLGSTCILDGRTTDAASPDPSSMEPYVATMHIEGFPGQAGTSKWAVVMGDQASADLGTDRAGNARIHVNGGFRAGAMARNYGRLAGTSEKGLIPMYPIMPVHWRRSDDALFILGWMRDVRGVSLEHFAVEQEITIGSDTWQVFPTRIRYSGSGSTVGTSNYQGIAYRQVA